MSTKASRRDVIRIRLARHGLAGPQPGTGTGTVTDVVGRMLALQAQDYAAAKWAIGLRSPGATLADVDAAINSGAIVRSWPMRGTLHFVPAADLGWMQQLTSPRVVAGTRARHAQLDIDLLDIERARAVARQSLSGGRELTRAGFLAALDEAGISTSGQRGYHLIGHLALTGTLCWGPQRGKRQVLVLLEDWVRSPRRLDRDEALGEFVLRYFGGHGPATLQDFAWWSHLTLADARVGLAVARHRLAELVVRGVTYYHPATDDVGSGRSDSARATQRRPLLALPGFDEYLLGYRDRSFAIENGSLTRVVPGRNGVFLPLILASGRVTGTWRQRKTAETVTIDALPFTTFSANQAREFERTVADYARFLGLSAGGIRR